MKLEINPPQTPHPLPHPSIVYLVDGVWCAQVYVPIDESCIYHGIQPGDRFDCRIGPDHNGRATAYPIGPVH